MDSDSDYDSLVEGSPVFKSKKKPPASPPVATQLLMTPMVPSIAPKMAVGSMKPAPKLPKLCPRGCLFKCSYYSPSGITKDWCPPIPPFHNIPAHCSGPCACSDFFWDHLILELENSDISSYYTVLRECKDPTDLHLHIPDKSDVDLIVENFYWNAKAELAGMDPAEVSVLDLPPCMCRMYANIDSIFTDWEEQKNRLIDKHEKSKRKLLQKAQKDRSSKKKRVLHF
jgi:hypothetical protein